MSTSSSAADGDTAAIRVSPFPYRELNASRETLCRVDGQWGQPESEACGAGEATVSEQVARAGQSGYERGRREAEAAAKAAGEEALGRQRSRVEECLRQFELEKQRYFGQVEAEVIQLALAIARRVLGREAAVDTLLLAGAVRAALERLGQTSKVSVLVHPAAAARWRTALVDHLAAIEFGEDDALPPEGCVLRTPVGTTEITLSQQIQDVEGSFVELLARRPATEKALRVQ